MIRSFKDPGTEDIFYGRNTTNARRTCSQQLWRVTARKLDQLDSVNALDQLRIPPGNRLESLSGDRDGYRAIVLNQVRPGGTTWKLTNILRMLFDILERGRSGQPSEPELHSFRG